MYQAESERLSLVRVAHGAHGVADLAECPRVVDEHGDPLRALVVRSAPIAPGIHVQVRPLALLHDLSGSPILVAAPTADERAPSEADIEALRPQLERLADAGGGYAQSSWAWSDTHVAASYVQEAVARGMRLHAGRRAVSAWAGLGGEGAAGATAAEAQVGRLPLRFQEFVREQLDEDERISLFVHRPQSRPPGIFTRAIPEALLVATDRQMLWLEDVRPVGRDMMSYGYDARAIPIERIAAVERGAGHLGERLRIRGEAGGPELTIDLPAAAARASADAEEILRRFIDRRAPLPRRLYAPRPPRDPLVIPEGWPELEPVARGLLDHLVAERGAPLLAAFVVPGTRGDPQCLLALYPEALLLEPVPAPGAKREVYPLAGIAWVELRRSLLTSHLRIVGRRERRWSSASVVPVLSLYRPLRQLVANAAPPRTSPAAGRGDPRQAAEPENDR